MSKQNFSKMTESKNSSSAESELFEFDDLDDFASAEGDTEYSSSASSDDEYPDYDESSSSAESELFKFDNFDDFASPEDVTV
jgi:hypothetical protein